MDNNINNLFKQYLELDDSSCTEENYVDNIEALIEKANAYAREGNELIPDSIWDTLMDILGKLRPDSPVLHQVWSGDDETVAFDEDIDRFLVTHPMLSIQTIKDIDDQPVNNFIAKMPDSVEMNFSVKENGHGIRIVYKNGRLVKATSRGRSTNGRDLTRQMKLVLGEMMPGLQSIGICEIRGEVLLPFSNLDKAKTFNPDIKSAFSGVSSMLRDSATEEETKLLNFVAYDLLLTDADTARLKITKLTEKFLYLQKFGFTVPFFKVFNIAKANAKQQFISVVERMAEATKDYEYYTDGVVAAIDDNQVFSNFGAEDKFRLGNLAFKIGRWEQNVYCGVVKEIKWKPGKNKLSPVCLVCDPDTGEEGVLTGTGNRVRNVPVYAPCHIINLGAYPGEKIYFKYGGEAGVVPCYANGLLVTDGDMGSKKFFDENIVPDYKPDEDDTDYTEYVDDDYDESGIDDFLMYHDPDED